MEIPGNKKFISTKTKVLSILLFVFFVSLPTYASNISSEEILNLTNQSRSQYSLPPLQLNEKLTDAASDKSRDMIKNNYFSHTSPSNISPWYWFRINDYEYKLAGENLAINYYDAKSQHEAWMQSELHRKNILEKNYQETGISVQEGNINGKDVIITVQLFATPKIASIGQLVGKSDTQKSELSPAVKQIASAQRKAFNSEFSGIVKDKNLRLEPKITIDYPSEKEAYVLGKSRKAIERNVQQMLLFLFLVTITITIHLNVLSSINPKRLHHLSVTNILVLVIVVSFLIKL